MSFEPRPWPPEPPTPRAVGQPSADRLLAMTGHLLAIALGPLPAWLLFAVTLPPRRSFLRRHLMRAARFHGIVWGVLLALVLATIAWPIFVVLLILLVGVLLPAAVFTAVRDAKTAASGEVVLDG